MAITEIKYGSLASSKELNDNFNALNKDIQDLATSLSTTNANMAMSISTLNKNVTNQITSDLQTMYPIGAIYISTTETCPIANLFGTWEKVSEGRVLQGADEGHEAGTTIPAGLPNVTGAFSVGNNIDYNRVWTANGAFYNNGTRYNCNAGNGGSASYERTINFDGSRSSSIYGQSDTVQPPAFVVNIWRRTA